MSKTPKQKRAKRSSPPKDKGTNHDPLTQYMEEISRIKILTREQEIKLATSIKDGDPKAIQEMVRRNLKYVVTVANKYRGLGISLQDLIEEGNIGLIQAAKRFDVSRNVKFIIRCMVDQTGHHAFPRRAVGHREASRQASRKSQQDQQKEPADGTSPGA